MRDGVSLTQRREMRSLALPSEIMRLENLQGYLKFPGPWPVARIGLDYVTRPKAAERFVPREEAAAQVTDAVESGPPEDDGGIAASPSEPAIESRQEELALKHPQGSRSGTRERVEAAKSGQAAATLSEESARRPHQQSEKNETGAADGDGTDTQGGSALSLPEKGGNSTPRCGEPQPKPYQGRLRRL